MDDVLYANIDDPKTMDALFAEMVLTKEVFPPFIIGSNIKDYPLWPMIKRNIKFAGGFVRCIAKTSIKEIEALIKHDVDLYHKYCIDIQKVLTIEEIKIFNVKQISTYVNVVVGYRVKEIEEIILKLSPQEILYYITNVVKGTWSTAESKLSQDPKIWQDYITFCSHYK